MDPISQGLLGAALPQSTAPRDRIGRYALLGGLAGMAPDLDVLIRSSSDPLMFLEFHRQFTHALVFIPVGAAVCALILYPFVRRQLGVVETYLACVLGYATHGLLDACTSYGTQLFWPFSTARIAWNNVSVIDPLFSLPLLILVVMAVWRQRPRYAAAGLVWALAYLLLGVVQHDRALAAGHTLVDARGHTSVRVDAKPGFGNLLLWKVVYEYDGRFYVDAVRAGISVDICEGQSIEKLDIGRHFPWLDQASQQHRDIERFRWFSDGYLGWSHHDPLAIVDMRYSAMPNEIAPLWGIRLSPEAHGANHVTYFTDRAGRARQSTGYWDMLADGQC